MWPSEQVVVARFVSSDVYSQSRTCAVLQDAERVCV